MNQDLGQVFAKDANFTIYSMGTENTGLYFVCVPNELKSFLKVFVDLHKKDDFSMYREINDPLRREELIDKLRDVNKLVNDINKSGVYVMPVIDIAAVENLNDQSKTDEFNRVFKMIANCTKDVSEKLNSASNGQKTIEQAITIIEQTESDKQFISWLKQQFPTFVTSITLDDLRKQYLVEQQMVNKAIVPENVNMGSIDATVVSNTFSPVQSSVNVSDDTMVSIAQTNVQNGETVNQMKNDDLVSHIQTQSLQNENGQLMNFSSQQVQSNLTDDVSKENGEVISRAPIVHIAPGGIAPVDHSLDGVSFQQKDEKGHSLTKTPNNKSVSNIARAGFVKFPVFLLTIMAIGAFGIFIGKMFYMYLSQQ